MAEIATQQKSRRLPYLEQLKLDREAETDEEAIELWQIVLKLAETPEADSDVVSRVYDEIQAFSANSEPGSTKPDHTRQLMYGEVCEYTLSLVPVYDESHFVHHRLLALLRNFPLKASQDQTTESPELRHDPDMLAEHAAELRRSRGIRHVANSIEDTVAEANTFVNTATFLAELLEAELLPRQEGVRWAAQALRDGLEPQEISQWEHPMPEWAVEACIYAALQYILHAGDQIVEELKLEPPAKQIPWLTKEKWKLWVIRLEELYSTAGDDSPWHIKSTVAATHAKMLELIPKAVTLWK